MYNNLLANLITSVKYALLKGKSLAPHGLGFESCKGVGLSSLSCGEAIQLAVAYGMSVQDH